MHQLVMKSIYEIDNYTTVLCRQEVEVIRNYENAKVHNIAQVEAQHTEYKRLKF